MGSITTGPAAIDLADLQEFLMINLKTTVIHLSSVNTYRANTTQIFVYFGEMLAVQVQF